MGRPFSSDYSRVYDLVYAAKNYRAEAARVHRLIQQYNSQANRLLELGAGTGGHARFLSGIYRMVCVERSPSMISIARRKLEGRSVRLVCQDISRIPSLGKRFGACMSLFHVVNYLEPRDLVSVLARLGKNLDPGGVLIFDSWNGAAVLRNPPVTRSTRIRKGSRVFVRRVRPRWDWKLSTVDVEIRLEEIQGHRAHLRSVEHHRMRYYFPAELRLLLEKAGFNVRRITRDDGRPLSPDDWSMLIVATRPG